MSDISFLENMHFGLMWKWTCYRLQAIQNHRHIHTVPLFWAFVHFLPVILTNLGLSILHKDTKKTATVSSAFLSWSIFFFFSQLKDRCGFFLFFYFFLTLKLLTILVIQ